MNIQYYHLNLSSEEDKEKFFKFAIFHQLYLKKEDVAFESRMLNIYNKKRDSEELSLILALDKTIPVGIVLCENDDKRHNLALYKEKRNGGFVIAEEKDVFLLSAGFLSFYVKEEYRNIGIAKNLMSLIESHRIKEVSPSITENLYFAFNGRERALEIINNSNQSFPLSIKEGSYNFPIEISQIYRYIYPLFNDIECNPQYLRNLYNPKNKLNNINLNLCKNTNIEDLDYIIQSSSIEKAKKITI